MEEDHVGDESVVGSFERIKLSDVFGQLAEDVGRLGAGEQVGGTVVLVQGDPAHVGEGRIVVGNPGNLD